MENIKWKKIKLSPHSRDKVGLFARDYDRDLYLENDVWSPYAFETKAYPENEEKYAYFKFNQDAYAEDKHTARDEAIEVLEAKEEKRRAAEKKITEEQALEKAKKVEAKKPTPPKPKAAPAKAKKVVSKDHDSLNDLEKLYNEAVESKKR